VDSASKDRGQTVVTVEGMIGVGVAALRLRRVGVITSQSGGVPMTACGDIESYNCHWCPVLRSLS
jgi:hypothetical protein